jgi:hypothetical protein
MAVTPGDLVPFLCRSAKFPTDAISGVTHAFVQHTTVVVDEPPAAGERGDGEQAITKQEITVTLFGKNPNALRALLSAAAANLVIGYKGEGGANQKDTLKNVRWRAIVSNLNYPSPDQGGPLPTVGVVGRCEWGPTDTLALMWTSAAE